MDPAEVLAKLGEDADPAPIAVHWDASAAAMPDGPIPFLQPEQVTACRDWSGLGPDVDPTLLAAARAVSADPALRRLAWHCKWLLVDLPEPQELKGWPTLERAIGPLAGAFYLLIALAIVQAMREHHHALDIPDDVSRQTCLRIAAECRRYRDERGVAGLPFRKLSWLRHYPREPYLGFGPLEYWLKRNPCEPLVYRHAPTGRTVALAPDGRRFTSDGYIDPEPDAEPGARYWRSALTCTADGVHGNPIAPWGVALPHRVMLPAPEWRRALSPGDWILQVHLPPSADLRREPVGRSFRAAVDFFRDLFPERPARAFVSTSWTFSNQLESMLSSDSSLVRFQRELYLFPIPWLPHGGFSYIFPDGAFDLETAPRRTRLQRGIVDLLRSGGRWRGGGMFYLCDDVDAFGARPYLTAWPELAASLGLPADGATQPRA